MPFYFPLQHPNYDQGPGFIPNDITYIRATSNIGGPNIIAGTLPPNENPGGMGWITGWGRTCGRQATL